MDLGDSNLRPLRVLGQGTFGRVFLCRCCKCKKPHDVCVKRIIVQNQRVEMKMILEEVYIISQLHHPNIVKFYRSFVHVGTVNIVMEYVSNGTMRDMIKRCQYPISKHYLLRYFCDILKGIEYLHIRHVIHRDLKPENLLIDGQGRIKITDFGISTIHTPSKQYMNAAGTPYYMAPEVLRGGRFDFKTDIWSFGCILYEICTGCNPFQFATNLPDLLSLVRALTRPKMDCKKIAFDYGLVWARLCEMMLYYDSNKRISIPGIACLDRSITIPFYHQYFDYEY